MSKEDFETIKTKDGMVDIKYYHDLAQQKHQEHEKFLATLRKKKPKHLDKIVKETHQEIFDVVDCTKCAKAFRMHLGHFEDAYLRVDEDGDKVFKCMPCPFLGSDNLCTIYPIRPKACREFPHTDRKKIYQINHLTIQNTLYCPAAYLFVERLKEKLGY